jgi:hypothetical protein
MADDDRHDDAELASAYLDGEVTAAERARVDADAGLLADVDRLRRARDAFADVPPAPAAGREAAIAAALAAFDAGDTAGPQAPPNVVPLGSRRRARRMQALTVAAAGLLVVAGGLVVATRGGGDGDGDSADVQREPAAVSALGEAPTTTPAAAGTTALATSTTVAPSAAAADAESAASAAEFDQPMAAAPAAAEVTPVDTSLSEIKTANDLAALGDLTATLIAEPPPLPDVVDACQDGEIVPAARYVDERGPAIDVALATDDGEIVAVSVEDCTVVLRTGT